MPWRRWCQRVLVTSQQTRADMRTQGKCCSAAVLSLIDRWVRGGAQP